VLREGETAVIHDRVLKPSYLKAFIPWWFLNDDEQHVEDARRGTSRTYSRGLGDSLTRRCLVLGAKRKSSARSEHYRF
jgi:hypothetical protein